MLTQQQQFIFDIFHMLNVIILPEKYNQLNGLQIQLNNLSRVNQNVMTYFENVY